MSKSIVFKLFLLTTGLCLLVIVSVFVGQTVFFERYYVQQKVEKIEDTLATYRQYTLSHARDAETSMELEQAFYEETNAWLAIVDETGYLKYADDYEMSIRLEHSATSTAFSEASITIPLYAVMDVQRAAVDSLFFPDFMHDGQRLALEGIVIAGKLYPQRIARSASNLREENRLENERLVNKEYDVVSLFDDPYVYRERYPSVLTYGTVMQIRLPQGEHASRYTNRLFLDRVKAFQADLLYGDALVDSGVVEEYEENGIDYRIFIEHVTDSSGKPTYLLAMTSLQPVHEASEVMQSYYVYIVIVTILLVLLASLYFSRRIARPLLRLDKMTQRMAKLDFSEKLPINTDDEIGNLSRNINRLSDMLNEHIVRLEQDIDKERRLEETRKQFISGVSHELKTPLSVLESCLYILQDKVDSPKRDYYFAAMEEEVKRMSLLVTDMLELSRYESGTYKLKIEAVRIDEVLERVCEKLAPDMAVKRLQLHTKLIPVEAMANRNRIEQVIINFMTNAIRYTPEQQTIFVSAVEHSETVNISIENKGAHIPVVQMDQIWDRFYRGEHSRHRATGGTGLGLAISKQILELHGARYGVSNTEDGVLFYFELNKYKKV